MWKVEIRERDSGRDVTVIEDARLAFEGIKSLSDPRNPGDEALIATTRAGEFIAGIGLVGDFEFTDSGFVATGPAIGEDGDHRDEEAWQWEKWTASVEHGLEGPSTS